MALEVRGNQLNGLVRQTGDSVQQLDDGSWEATVIYVCRWARVQLLAPRRNSSRHPDFAPLICTRCSIERLKPGLVARLSTTYRGFFGREEDPPLGNTTEEVVTSTSDAPIETHPEFTDVIGGSKSEPLNGAIFDDDGSFKGWKSDSPYAGIESYLIASTIYRKTTPSRARPTSIGPVGRLSTQPGIGGGALGANWLYTNKSWRRDGGVYEVTEEFMLSGPGGWNTTIYS